MTDDTFQFLPVDDSLAANDSATVGGAGKVKFDRLTLKKYSDDDAPSRFAADALALDVEAVDAFAASAFDWLG